MTGYLNLILRLAIWFLLTADFGLTNIIIGVTVCLLLPRTHRSPGRLEDWLQALWKVMKAVPQAYLEAFQMMIKPHTKVVIMRQKAPPQRTPGLVFLDIFLITFTPKTIVFNYEHDEHHDDWYAIHKIQPKEIQP
ncbi:Na+/H+ antiporter subunit E [Synechococcus sp. PCC 6312]|uniref:Na+/H+ antiporter subunit E n=1 Tax=Synechococcus sp. (strain ATCC 27167 / PCC 6312) TaxID=195253 RepID=UPI00029F4765|nr:Na+/H+ antiporter subunit E [Synechococcus sp. PCC 6312]AFY62070.1 multisubunit Na+/H+ antiporter, MnhE subunit [Synechococcus sp. PCC 6312]